ncbi:MAG: permease [Deltaproteobacteria bacterium]|nr:permease [Deltaproteobacteria bacterium]MBW2339783.1 permease [Deltaproteobacteria bacterium]
MNKRALLINVFAFACLLISLIRNKEKTKQSLIGAVKSFFRILPMVFIVIIVIGLLLGFVPPAKISDIVGEQAGFGGLILIAFLGTTLHIPALISFPLVASLLKGGASVTAVAAFITTLTMVGIVTLPLEIKELGKKITLLRNGISFIFAIIIALIIGAIL